MARRIKLQFYDKTYTIEYANRIEVKEYFAKLNEIKKNGEFENEIEAMLILLKAGLVEHHKNEMPSDEELIRWITSINLKPQAKLFAETLTGMVQEVVSVIDSDVKNLKWEVEEA